MGCVQRTHLDRVAMSERSLGEAKLESNLKKEIRKSYEIRKDKE